MTAVKDFKPKDWNDDPNFDYQLTSKLDHPDLNQARADAADNIATDGSSVPRAFFLQGGDGTRATPATELSGNDTAGKTVKRVELTPSTVTVAVGATTQLTPNVMPSDATTKTVSYGSSDTSKATVNSSGLVTGVAAGTSTVTVTTTDQAKTDTTVVTVVAA